MKKQPHQLALNTFEEGSVVWLPDPIEIFIPVRVVKAFEKGHPGKVVKLRPYEQGFQHEDDQSRIHRLSNRGTQRQVLRNSFTQTSVSAEESKKLLRVDERGLVPIADMIEMIEISEASILHNLRMRFFEKKVYTAIGSLLVSINPFDALPLYTPEMVERFKNVGTVADRISLGPHVYAMAHEAYTKMVSNRKNQAMIVSGESGSGKTEYAKLLLQYLMEVSPSENEEIVSMTSEDDDSVEEIKLSLTTKILMSAPALEAFGNAQTTRNDNSSRHGKWLSIQFHPQRGSVLGANYQVYLLEKSRLVDCDRLPGERNFHVFYQLCSDRQLQESLQLSGGVDSFRYLERRTTEESRVTNDGRAWLDTVRSLRTVGMTAEREGQLFQILAGILHLGNVTFVEESSNNGGSKVKDMKILELASELFSIDTSKLLVTLTQKDLSNSKEKLFQLRSVVQAGEVRDALAKFVYSQIFDFVVRTIGQALKGEHSIPGVSEIGILDIFGFEVFDKQNSFEQLLINYANEALQEKFFNKFVFEAEREEYLFQGMSASEAQALCAYVSTEDCLRMFEDKPGGIFRTLEDEIILPKASDESFLNRFAKTAKPYAKVFSRPKNIALGRFSVMHYAGEVEYTIKGFLEKSRDAVDPALQDLVFSSSGLLGVIGKQVDIVLTSPQSNRISTKKTLTQKTLGTKFVQELGALISSLELMEPHFARCIKPNDEKSSSKFDSKLVMHQLRCSGLLNVCHVRRSGFPVRFSFADFLFRFKCIYPTVSNEKELFTLAVGSGEGYFGKSKILLRDSARDFLEFKREEALKGHVTLIQKMIRAKLARKQVDGLKAGLLQLESLSLRANNEGHLKEMDDLMYALEVSPSHPTMRKARTAKQVLERKIVLRNMLTKVSTPQQAAVAKQEALALGIKEDDDMLISVNALLTTKQKSTQRKEALEEAMESRNLPLLEKQLLQETAVEDLDAITLRDRLRKENEALADLERAMKSDSYLEESNKQRTETLRAAVRVVLQLGMENHPTTIAGVKLLKKWKRTENESKDLHQLAVQTNADGKRVLEKIKLATGEHNYKVLSEARHEALELGLDRRPEVQRAARLLKQLDEESNLGSSLAVVSDFVMAKAQLKSGTGLVHLDLERLAETITVAKQRGVPPTSHDFVFAQDVERKCRQQFKIQVGLSDALGTKDYARMRTILKEIPEGLDNDLIRRCRAVASNRAGGENGAKPFRTQSTKTRTLEISKMSQLEFEKKRIRRLAEARNPKNDWWNLEDVGIIRLTEDYAFRKAGFLRVNFNKHAAKTKLTWSGEVIPKSLTVKCGKESDRLSKRALLMNKAILGYCGDLVLPFPSVLAQQILEAALLDPPLADELWVQLLRQLTQNPYEDSERRAWMLVCVCASCVGPYSVEVEDAVLYFLLFQSQHLDGNRVDSVHREYARFALRKFESLVLDGPSGRIPTSEEVMAFQERPPLLANVCLPDGLELARDVPVSPDTTALELVETCCETYGLSSKNAFMFALFVEPDPQNVTERRNRRLKRAEIATKLETLDTVEPPISATFLSPTAATATTTPTAQRKRSIFQTPPARLTTSGKKRPSGMLKRASLTMFSLLSGNSASKTETRLENGGDDDDDIPLTIFEEHAIKQEVIMESEDPSFSAMPPPRSTLEKKKNPPRRSSYLVESTKTKLTPKIALPVVSMEPLVSSEFMGDVLSRHLANQTSSLGSRLVFILRRKVAFKSGNEPPKAEVKDKGAYVSLCYLDCLEEILNGNWAVKTKQAMAQLAALCICELRKGQKPLVGQIPNFARYLSEFLPLAWQQEELNKEMWSTLIQESLANLQVNSGRSCRKQFLELAFGQCSNFGQICFQVRSGANLDEDVVLGCDYLGIHLLKMDLFRTEFFFVPHIRVKKIDSFAENCTVQCWDEKHNKVSDTLVLITSQGHEISAFLWELSSSKF